MQYQIPSPHPPIQGPSVQQTFPVPRVAQPEMSRYAALQANRFLIAAIPSVHQGATIQRTDPIANFGDTVLALYPGRQQLANAQDLSQAAAALQKDVFATPQPNLAAWPGRQQLPDIQWFDGAAIQVAPIPGVSLIEMSRYSGLQSARSITGSVPHIHQGATNQDSYVNQPQGLVISYGFAISQIPTSVHGTPAIVQADTFPPSNKIELSRWRILESARLISGTVYAHAGATIQSTDRIPAVDKIEMSRYSLLDSARLIPGALVYRHQGATVLSTDPIPGVAAIEMSRYLLAQLARSIPVAIAQVHQGATVIDSVPVPGVALLEMSRYRFLESVRTIPGAVPQVHQGATIQRTDPILPFGQPVLSLYPGRQQLAKAQELGQAAAVVISDIFALPMPNLSRWPGRQQLPEIVSFDGATVQATSPIPGVSLVEMSRYRFLETVRLIPGAIIQLHQGATIQATNPIPAVARIEMSAYAALQFSRLIPGASIYLNQGSTILSTDPIPGVAQIQMSAYSRLKDSVRLIPGAVIQLSGATVQQTYIFPLSQANRAQWIPPQYADAIRRFDGATIQQTYIFTQPAPNLSAWPVRQYADAIKRLEQTAAAAQTDVFQLPRPGGAWWVTRQYVEAVKRFEGATIQRTDPILPFGLPMLSLYPKPQFPGVTAQLGQITQTDVFRLSVPNLAAWPTPQQYPGVPRRTEGAIVQAAEPILPTSKIEMSRYALLNSVRLIPGAVIQIQQGSTILATDPIPPVARIEMSRYSIRETVRPLTLAIAQFTGATLQQTLPVPGVAPIEMNAYSRVRESVRQIPGAAVQLFDVTDARRQTYIFPQPLPNLAWWPTTTSPDPGRYFRGPYYPGTFGARLIVCDTSVRSLSGAYAVHSFSGEYTVGSSTADYTVRSLSIDKTVESLSPSKTVKDIC